MSLEVKTAASEKVSGESAMDVYRRINEWCIKGISTAEKFPGLEEEEYNDEEDDEEGKEEMQLSQATIEPFDCLAPRGKDLEHPLCSPESKKWEPAISHKGLLQLEHFLHSYQKKEDLIWLGIEYDPNIIHSIRADRQVYLPIVEEATALLLSEDESLVACFIGFIRREPYLNDSSLSKSKLNGLPNYPHKNINFPTAEIFVDVIAHAHQRLSNDKIDRIARAIVSTCETTSDLSDAISNVKQGLVVDTNECPEPINPLSEVDFTPEELLERKTRGVALEVLSTWIVTVMEDEAQGMDLKVVEEHQDDHDGQQDYPDEEDDDDLEHPNGQSTGQYQSFQYQGQGQNANGYGGGWA